VLLGVQKEISAWIIKVKKIKAIYHTLNMCNFDLSHNSLIAECWCPVDDLDRIQQALRRGTVSQILEHLVVVCVDTVCRSFNKGQYQVLLPT